MKPRRRLNPQWLVWRKAKMHHLSQIDKYENTYSINGQLWLDKMTKYHLRALGELNASKPERLVER